MQIPVWESPKTFTAGRMKLPLILSISIALPTLSMAQIFSIQEPIITRMGGAVVHGQLDTQVEVSGASLGWVSSLVAGAPMSYFQTRTETIVVPQAFPLPPLRFTEVFSGTFSISSVAPVASVATGLQTPTFNIPLNGFTIPNVSAPVAIEISVSYSLTSNGNPVASGTGTYNIFGTFSPILAINTDLYPSSVRPVFNYSAHPGVFSPSDNLPLISLTTAPSGQVYDVAKLGLMVGVPEPLHYGLVFSGCLIAFGFIRRKGLR